MGDFPKMSNSLNISTIITHFHSSPIISITIFPYFTPLIPHLMVLRVKTGFIFQLLVHKEQQTGFDQCPWCDLLGITIERQLGYTLAASRTGILPSLAGLFEDDPTI